MGAYMANSRGGVLQVSARMLAVRMSRAVLQMLSLWL